MIKELIKNKSLLTGALMICLITLVALFAPLICHDAPDHIDGSSLLSPLSRQHILGTDQLGRDLFSRLSYGARISLAVGFLVIIISTLIGLVIGSMAGYYGGAIDYALMRTTDIMLCFPVFFLILAVVAMLEPSTFNIILILGLTSWTGQARLVRAEILSLKSREYILIAKAMGARDGYLIVRHLIPNAMGPVIVTSVLGIAGAILAESSLSFLGVGIQPPTPSWGNMLNDARATLGVAWWQSAFPGMAILWTIIGFYLLAEGLKNYFRRTAHT
jgi:peptide/nickel transport system permease protein